MSWHGKQHRGAMRDHLAAKRAAAEARNAATPVERTAEARRQCPGKHVYCTEEEAQHALLDAQIARVLKHNGRRRETRAYYCRACGGWHLTSRPERTEQAA